MKRQNLGFTLVEIMIVVAILGILLAILAPGFVKARRQTRDRMCQNNLRLIDHALEQYKIDENLADGVDVTGIYNGIIVGDQDAYIEEEPLCPIEERSYTVTLIEANPTCPNRDDDPTDVDASRHLIE